MQLLNCLKQIGQRNFAEFLISGQEKDKAGAALKFSLVCEVSKVGKF